MQTYCSAGFRTCLQGLNSLVVLLARRLMLLDDALQRLHLRPAVRQLHARLLNPLLQLPCPQQLFLMQSAPRGVKLANEILTVYWLVS